MTNSPQDVSPLLSAKQQLLRKLLQEKRASRSAPPSQMIPHLEQEYAPLSFAQQRLWFLEQLGASNSPYNMSGANRLHGLLHLEILEKSVQGIMRRHTVLRTVFVNQDGYPVQHIRDSLDMTIPLIDLTPLSGPEQEHEISQLARSEPQQAFDFVQGPLFRLTLLRLQNDEHVLLATFHHIIADAWSLGIFTSELSQFYTALCDQHGSVPTDQATRLPDLPIQYTDFARWQRERLQDESFKKHLDYWRQQLVGSSERGQAPFLHLPTDRPRPAIQSFPGARLSRLLSPDLHQQLKSLSQRENVTLFMTGLAAFQVLLMRYSGQSDIVVGSPIAHRTRKELEGLIGFFVNMLVLRTDLSGNPTFQQLLGRVRQTVVQAYAHQEVPFEKLVEELQPERDLSYQPLFQVSFNMLDVPASKLEIPDVTFHPMEVEQTTSQFDLSLSLNERRSGPVPDGLLTTLEYNTDLFDATTMERLLEHWQVLLEALVRDPAQPIKTLPLLTESEFEQLLVQWNMTKTDYPQDQCVHQLFEQQVEQTPDSVALVFESEVLTYRELNRRANQLAHHLQTLGIGPEVLVGICFERSIEMVISLLAVLKAGGAYVPLDPGLPQERLAYMIQDAQVAVLLTQPHLQERLRAESVPIMVVDLEMQGQEDNPLSVIHPDHLIYMIFTSGSTGKPKGVMNTHRALSNRLLWMQQTYQLTHEDRILQKTPFSFDVSFWEFFWPLLTGASLIVARPGGHLDPTYLRTLITEQQVTTLHFVPSMLQVFLWDEPIGESPQLESGTSLRQVICSGEALSGELQARFFAHFAEGVTLQNLYGPTEAAIDVTFWSCQRRVGQPEWRVPIGRPIANTRIYLLDRNWQPVPIGVTGELYIAGEGLARGYARHPELTAEKFMANPFGRIEGERMYRTGDLARYRSDGAIEYLERIDNQIKLRGFRIELGEIEAVLLKHEGVKDAAVSVWEETRGDKRLVAYIREDESVAKEHRSSLTNTGELRRYLQDKLPDYMVPAMFVQLEELRRTSNGKLDRTALPIPGQMRSEQDSAMVLARTPTEEVLAAIWASVLGREKVGIHENFFALGGDSIRSIQVLFQARKRGLHFSLQQLFQRQTIAELAQVSGTETQKFLLVEPVQAFSLISSQDQVKLPADVDDAYPLTMLQAGMVFHSQYDPASAVYHDIFSFHFEAPFNLQLLQTTLERLAACHPILRTSFDLSTFSEPLQLVHRSVDIPLQVQDLRTFSPIEQEEKLSVWFEEEKSRDFVWEHPPLLRFQIHLRSEITFQLTLSFHHAILDGWSVASLLTELMKIYLALLSGEAAPSTSAPALLFRDFVALERKLITSQEAKQYWSEKLQGSISVKLPRWTSSRQEASNTSVYALSVPISSETGASLRKIALSIAVPLKSVLLAAHLKVLSILHGERDILTGIALNGRPEVEDGERTLGTFLNTLPLRLKLSGGTWIELIQETFAAECELLPHRWYPLIEIQKQQSGFAHFETLFYFVHFHVYQDILTVGKETSPLPFQILDRDIFEKTNFTLAANFFVHPISSEVHLSLICDTKELSLEQVKAIGDYYTHALDALAREPYGYYQWQTLLSTQEREQLLARWNATKTNCSLDRCVHQFFEQQVQQTPDAIAIVEAGLASAHNPHVLTYGELNARANQLAHRLQAIGIGSEKLVAVYMQRSLELIVALLAILKAGGTYLPLDPDYPQARLASILADAQPAVLLTEQRLSSHLSYHGPLTLCLDRDWKVLAKECQSNLVNTTLPEQTAYIIYTSGSTGTPKGVMVSHRNIVNFFHGMDEHIGETTPSIWLAVTSISFDISVLELFWTLTRGIQVVVYTPLEHVGVGGGVEHGGGLGRPLAFSLFYFASHAAEQYRLLLEGAKFADEHGFQALWTPERHFHAFGGLYPNPSVTSAAVAAVTQHIQIRAGSVVLPLHHPIRIAEDWAVVDNLSHGRVGIAFASGWHTNDFVFAPDKYAQRRELLTQDIETVRKLWRGESIVVQGGTGQHIEVKTHPRPVQAELPVWITSAGNPETFRLAGEAGVNILTHLLGQDLDQLAAKIAVYREAWHQHGHDAQGNAGHVTLMIHTFIGTDLQTVRETVRQPFRTYLRSSLDLLQGFAHSLGLDMSAESFHEDDLEALLDHAFERYFETSGLMGTVDSCLPMIENLKAVGVDELACLIDFGIAVNDVLSSLPHLQELKVGVGGGVGWGGGLDRPYPPTTQKNLSLSAQLLEYGVSHLQCTPSLMHMVLMDPLASTALKGVSHILLGGEELPIALVKQLQTLTTAKLHNMYGPTETTIWSTTSVIESSTEVVSLGGPIANTQIYLLDAHLEPVPVGVAGEMYIGGKGLARGYKDRADLTAEQFLPNPWDEDEGGRLYRTGDVARYHEDGQLEYLGRKDQQVKLRGHRLELGEIEASLRTHPAIQEVVVVLREEHEIGKHLVAYVVMVGVGGPCANPVPTDTPTRDDLYAHLRRQLPQYMIPASIVFLERLPLTPNGKIDRKALPASDRSQLPENAGGTLRATPLMPPQTPLQEQLALIWKELLHLPEVSIHWNFFALGGHSLLATQLMVRIQTAFEVKVPLRKLFDAPTIVEMAELIERIQSERRALLLRQLQMRQEESPKKSISSRKRDTSPLPLSFAQERLWFLHQLAPNSAWYVISQPLHLSGPLQMQALEHGLTAVVQRHEILRTTFSSQEGRPVQVITPNLVLQVPVIDLSGLLAAAVCEQEVKRLALQDAHHPFDLAHDLLLRLHMLRLPPDEGVVGTVLAPIQLPSQEHILLFTLHHIIFDGRRSIGILVRELSTLYEAELEGRPALLPALPFQYADYAIWQRQQLQGEVLESLLAYWRGQLSSVPAVLELPTDYPRKATRTDAGSKLTLLLSPALLQELQHLSHREGTTLFMTLLAAFQVLLMRYSGQTDIVVGTPITNVGQAEKEQAILQELIGFFVNTLVLRSDLSGNPSFRQLLARVREVALQAYMHQDLPFEKLVESLQVKRSLSHSPMFQVLFTLQNVPSPDIKLAGITISQLEAEHFTALFDLSLVVTPGEKGLLTEVEYSTDLFNAATITRLLNHWQVLLEAIVRNPEQKIELLPLLTKTERELVACGLAPQSELAPKVTQITATSTAASTKNLIEPSLCLHQLFEQQVEQAPDAIAVVFAGGGTLTYWELNTRANHLAHRLNQAGVGPEQFVGVCLERSLELIIALLAILKAGGAYVPLDPSYPQERLTWMLEDAQVSVVLTQTHLLSSAKLAHWLPASHPLFICLDAGTVGTGHDPTDQDGCASSNGELNTNRVSRVTPENLAYMIYTSGSTGKPKGVMVTHANVARLLTMTDHWFHLQARDIWTFFHSYAFDFSVWEIWGSLLHGSRLVVVPDWLSRSPDEFYQLLMAEQVTILNQTPSAFGPLMQEDLRYAERVELALRLIIFGGEALDLHSLGPWFARHGYQHPQLVNMYGITETTVHVTSHPLIQADVQENQGSVIGSPIPDLQCYVLDAHQQPVPLGIPGELYVGGMGLARGYWQQADVTAERFIPHPFVGTGSAHGLTIEAPVQQGARLYRTGDLVRYQATGSLEYLGRIDQQVKLRGFRIELGEIEATLLQHPGVYETIVTAKERSTGEKYLVAYLVPDTQTAFPIRQLLHLQRIGRIPFQQQYQLPNGMTIASKNKSETRFMYHEIFEEQTYVKNGITIEDGDCILDVGANIGIFSLFIGKNYKNTRIYAFEPVPTIFELLQLNVELYQLNAKLFACGLSNAARSEPFTYYPSVALISGRFANVEEEREVIKTFLLNQQEAEGQALSSHEIDELLAERLTKEHITCPMKTLSDVMREEGVERIDLLKIDVEKSELDVLEGIEEEDWQKIKQVVVEVHDINNRVKKITQLLRQHGYNVVIEQDMQLQETGLYNIYAIHSSRKSEPTPPIVHDNNKPETTYGWASIDTLLSDVRTFLKKTLPDYMVPSSMILLEGLPLTPNGKVDREALPVPAGTAPSSQGYVAPQSELEHRLAEIWQQVLNLTRVSIYDNFFDLGGHSLLLMQVRSKLQAYLGSKVPVVDLFNYPTIHALSTHLSERRALPPMLQPITERVRKRKEALQQAKPTRERIKR